jgi:hypothetical protein
MIELTKLQAAHARLPPTEELVKAWKAFFEYKSASKEPVNNYQAVHALNCLRHLLQTSGKDESVDAPSSDNILTTAELRTAARAITLMPNDKRNTHGEFARELYTELMRSGLKGDRRQDFARFVSVLTKTGSSSEARSLLEAKDQKPSQIVNKCWCRVIEGFAAEDNEPEVLRTFEMADSAGVPYSAFLHRIMTSFFADRNDIEQTKKWFSKPTNSSAQAPEAYSTILHFCIRNEEMEWCKTIFRNLLEGNPPKETWDIILQWVSRVPGKGVEDVERTMDVMIRHNEDDPFRRPDAASMNGLVALAMSLKDPYLAERYVALGIKHGIQPNAQTYIHQLIYRVSAGDLTGAHAAYISLQSEEILEQEDLPAINNYLRALCIAKSPNYDLITSICSDLEERKARLEAPTVSALGLLYLQRGEIPELINTLQTHTYHYTVSERASIRNAFLEFCLDPATPTVRSWDAYTVFRQIFDETSIEIRTQAMNEFFRRGRSDMALHAFGHMRQHIRSDRRPLLTTYVQCFEGIAQCADSEALDTVHNMMKLDSSIEPNTTLYNALMLAYAECESSSKAVSFWDDITNSREGPSYRSLEIVFRACQRKPFGDAKAREIWNQMRRMEIEVTKNVYVAYVGALAGQGQLEDTKELIEGAELDLGFKPDVQT